MTDLPDQERSLRQDLEAEVRRLRGEVRVLVGPLNDATFAWRPAPDRWSVGEHLAHLPLTTRPYLQAIDSALERARTRGLHGSGGGRGGWIGEWFVRSMEPPPRRRFRTFERLVPPRRVDRDGALADYERVLEEFLASLARAEGLDLGRARIRSPYLPLLRLSVGQAYRAVLAHDRRHVWHMRRALDDPRSPTSGGAA